MNLERIRQRLTNGFKPFALELSRGRRVAVRHPDLLTLDQGVVVVVGEDDSVTTLDALHIVAIEDLPAGRWRR